jgi:hypothetical protein
MEDVTRKRLERKLEGLPEEQLYQVMDFIEFLEAKYARESGRKPDPFQQFAERVEDQMRIRSVAPKAMKGTMRVMSTAGKVIDGVRELGRDLVRPPERRRPESGSPGGRAGGAGGAGSSRSVPDRSEPEAAGDGGGARGESADEGSPDAGPSGRSPGDG